MKSRYNISQTIKLRPEWFGAYGLNIETSTGKWKIIDT